LATRLRAATTIFGFVRGRGHLPSASNAFVSEMSALIASGEMPALIASGEVREPRMGPGERRWEL